MYKRILVVVGDDLASEQATATGIEIAKAHSAEILFFYVLPPYDIVLGGEDRLALANYSVNDFQREATSFAERKLMAATELAERQGVHSLRATGLEADVALCVANAAESRQCQMIVVATERKNAVMRMISGSIVPRLLTVATVPVLVCSTEGQTTHAPNSAAQAHSARATPDLS